MTKVKILGIDGTSVGELEVPERILSDAASNKQSVHEVVVAHMAAVRSGNASTLRKGEVAGSNRKPWRQKGTGRARAGLKQSPVWRGGGVAFGPHPRKYDKKVNRKVAAQALRSAVASRISNGDVTVLERAEILSAKTKDFVAMMKKLNIEGSALFVLAKIDENMRRASRNVRQVLLVSASDVSVYQLLKYDKVFADREGFDILLKRVAVDGGKDS